MATPALRRMRSIVHTAGGSRPSLVSSQAMAAAPTWAQESSIRRWRTAKTTRSSSAGVRLATVAGARERSAAQPVSLGSKRATHLRTQRSLRPRSAATLAVGWPASTRATASRRARSSALAIASSLARRHQRGGSSGQGCPRWNDVLPGEWGEQRNDVLPCSTERCPASSHLGCGFLGQPLFCAVVVDVVGPSGMPAGPDDP